MKTRSRYATQVRREAGWALKQSAPSQKILTAVLGCSEPWTSRQCNGHESGAASRFYEMVRTLLRDRRANVGHVIAGAMTVAEEEAVRLGEAEVRRRLFDALSQETHAQAAEDIAEYRVVVALTEDPPDLRAALEAHDEATRHEMAWHVEALIYNRALRVLLGWRVQP